MKHSTLIFRKILSYDIFWPAEPFSGSGVFISQYVPVIFFLQLIAQRSCDLHTVPSVYFRMYNYNLGIFVPMKGLIWPWHHYFNRFPPPFLLYSERDNIICTPNKNRTSHKIKQARVTEGFLVNFKAIRRNKKQ